MIFIIIFLSIFQIYSTLYSGGYYIYGYMPTFEGFIISLLCLLFWAAIGLYCGYKRDRRFIITASIVWLGEIAFYLIGCLLVSENVTGLITGSIYGLRYIIPLPRGLLLTVLINLIAYCVSALSFGIGQLISKNKNKSQNEETKFVD